MSPKGYISGNVPLNRICYDNCDVQPFRMYVLLAKDKDAMNLWETINHGKKSDRKRDYTYKYMRKWFKIIRDTPIGDTKFAWDSIPKQGRVLSAVRFAYDEDANIFYPSGGGTRVPSAYVLGHTHIPGFWMSTKLAVSWKSDASVRGRHFRGMPKSIIDKLNFRNEINNIFIKGVVSKKVRNEFLYKIPDLGFRGELDAATLLEDSDFLNAIHGKKVLNLIQDNGYLEVMLADQCKSIYTVGEYSRYIKISKKIKEYYSKNNIYHSKLKNHDYEHDVVISNSEKLMNKYSCDSSNIIYRNERMCCYGNAKV
jgi:hypothetical protein